MAHPSAEMNQTIAYSVQLTSPVDAHQDRAGFGDWNSWKGFPHRSSGEEGLGLKNVPGVLRGLAVNL